MERPEMLEAGDGRQSRCFFRHDVRPGIWGGAKSEAWRLMLDFLERWFRDVSWLQHGLPETQLLCPEFRDSLDEGVRRFSKRWVLELPEHLARLRESIELNANKPLALETLWLHLVKTA